MYLQLPSKTADDYGHFEYSSEHAELQFGQATS